jgi:hypothetical protein
VAGRAFKNVGACRKSERRVDDGREVGHSRVMATKAPDAEAQGGQLPKLRIFNRQGLKVCVGTTDGTIGASARQIIDSVTPKSARVVLSDTILDRAISPSLVAITS